MSTIYGHSYDSATITTRGFDNTGFTTENGDLPVSRIGYTSQQQDESKKCNTPPKRKKKKKQIFPAPSCLEAASPPRHKRKFREKKSKMKETTLEYGYKNDFTPAESRKTINDSCEQSEAQDVHEKLSDAPVLKQRSVIDDHAETLSLNVNHLQHSNATPVIIDNMHDTGRLNYHAGAPGPRDIKIDITTVQSSIVNPPNTGSYVEFNHSSLAPRPNKSAPVRQLPSQWHHDQARRPISAGNKKTELKPAAAKESGSPATRPFMMFPIKRQDDDSSPTRSTSPRLEVSTLYGTDV